MSEIQRWEQDHDSLFKCDADRNTGEWVLYSDHAAVIAAKDAEIADLKDDIEGLLSAQRSYREADEYSLSVVEDLRRLAREALEARNDETVGDIIGPEDLRWMEEGCWCEMNAYRTLRRIAGEVE